MTELEKLNALRYIYGFSFRKLDKKVEAFIPMRIMSEREIHRMIKKQNKISRLQNCSKTR